MVMDFPTLSEVMKSLHCHSWRLVTGPRDPQESLRPARVGEVSFIRSTAMKTAAIALLAILLFAPFDVDAQTVRDGYGGIVTSSAKRKTGERFTFANLRSNRPFVTYPSGTGAETYKVFEDEDILVLFFVAPISGSTETFYLHKKRNRFSLVEVGAMEAVVTEKDFRPDVTHGDLR